jgi:hypothetical protein
MTPPAAALTLRDRVTINLATRHKAEVLATLLVMSVLNIAIELRMNYEMLGVTTGIMLFVRDAMLVLLFVEEERLI